MSYARFALTVMGIGLAAYELYVASGHSGTFEPLGVPLRRLALSLIYLGLTVLGVGTINYLSYARYLRGDGYRAVIGVRTLRIPPVTMFVILMLIALGLSALGLIYVQG